MRNDTDSVAAAKFAEAVKNARDLVARYPETTDANLRVEINFAWPLSSREPGWTDRVVAKAREAK